MRAEALNQHYTSISENLFSSEGAALAVDAIKAIGRTYCFNDVPHISYAQEDTHHVLKICREALFKFGDETAIQSVQNYFESELPHNILHVRKSLRHYPLYTDPSNRYADAVREIFKDKPTLQEEHDLRQAVNNFNDASKAGRRNQPLFQSIIAINNSYKNSIRS